MNRSNEALRSARGSSSVDSDAPLLLIEELEVTFRTARGAARAVRGVSLDVWPGEVVAIVGESGAGKSVTARAALGLLSSPPATVGARQLRFGGIDLLGLDQQAYRRIRGREMSLIFQDAMSALDPGKKVGNQIAELLRVNGLTRDEARKRAIEALDQVRIPRARERAGDYPHQFSGGMLQRVLIALALVLRPRLVIADEPTTALDVTVQAEVLRVLLELKNDLGLAVLLISHDLGVVSGLADRVAVMYAGRIVELGPVDQVLQHPQHPYTSGLIQSAPSAATRLPLHSIPGSAPDLSGPLAPCAFAVRCPLAADPCWSIAPEMTTFPGGHFSECHFAADVEVWRGS